MKKQSFVKVIVGAALLMGALSCSNVFADDTTQLKQQVQSLQDRVNQLESQLANRQQGAEQIPYDQWADPFGQMMLLRDQMDRNTRQTFADTAIFSPRMDMKQTDKQYIITMDIPGMDKDKINVGIKEGLLTISGERQSETRNNKNNQYYRQERSFGSFMQSIPLPEDLKAGHIEAKYKNGVLTVEIPRNKSAISGGGAEKIKVM